MVFLFSKGGKGGYLEGGTVGIRFVVGSGGRGQGAYGVYKHKNPNAIFFDTFGVTTQGRSLNSVKALNRRQQKAPKRHVVDLAPCLVRFRALLCLGTWLTPDLSSVVV